MERNSTERETDWTRAWFEAQRVALAQWLGSGDPQAAEMLKSGTEHWARLFTGGAAPNTRDTGERLRSIGQQYLEGFQQLWATLGAAGPPPGSAEFQQRLHRALRDVASGDAARQFWAGLIPGLNEAAVPAATDWTRAFADVSREPWKVLFSIPPLGPAREHQADWTALQEALVAHERLAAQLSALLADVHRQTLAGLAERVAQRATSSDPIQSFRSLYDEWVSCGEEAFAAVAHGPDYVRLQGALGDSDARLRVRLRGVVERWARALDLPTRAELDTAHRRIRDLTRRLEAVEQGVAARGAGAVGATARATGIASPHAEVSQPRARKRGNAAPRRSRSRKPGRSTARGVDHGPHDADT